MVNPFLLGKRGKNPVVWLWVCGKISSGLGYKRLRKYVVVVVVGCVCLNILNLN